MCDGAVEEGESCVSILGLVTRGKIHEYAREDTFRCVSNESRAVEAARSPLSHSLAFCKNVFAYTSTKYE